MILGAQSEDTFDPEFGTNPSRPDSSDGGSDYRLDTARSDLLVSDRGSHEGSHDTASIIPEGSEENDQEDSDRHSDKKKSTSTTLMKETHTFSL
jgi:hypothetical protein